MNLKFVEIDCTPVEAAKLFQELGIDPSVLIQAKKAQDRENSWDFDDLQRLENDHLSGDVYRLWRFILSQGKEGATINQLREEMSLEGQQLGGVIRRLKKIVQTHFPNHLPALEEKRTNPFEKRYKAHQSVLDADSFEEGA